MVIPVEGSPPSSLEGAVFKLDGGAVGENHQSTVAVPFSACLLGCEGVVRCVSLGERFVPGDLTACEVINGVPGRDSALPEARGVGEFIELMPPP